MRQEIVMLGAVAAAGWLGGGSPIAFLCAALAVAAAAWRDHLTADATDCRCRVTLDPRAPDPAMLIAACRSASEQTLREDRSIVLRIAALRPAGGEAIRLGPDPAGDLEVTWGARAFKADRPNLWIADHPVPMEIPRDRCLALRIAPGGACRVRAALAAPAPLRARQGALLALTAAAAVMLDMGWLLAASCGFACRAGWPRNQEDGPPQNRRIQRP